MLGTPPPIPTIKANLIEGKAAVSCPATAAAKLFPIWPDGRHAITTL
jgi:hypothetical protein